MSPLLRDLFRLVAPPRCPACAGRLYGDSHGVCRTCWQTLPRVPYEGGDWHGWIERKFWTQPIPIERATAMFYYIDQVRRIVHAFKYHQHPELATTLARAWAEEMTGEDFFDGVEAIIPLPLHPLRRLRRGYNQSEHLARGLSQATGIPVVGGVVVRRGRYAQQARLERHERWANVEGKFRLRGDGRRIAGRHVLLVDDVFTSGSTILACAQALSQAPGARISLLTFAYANKTLPPIHLAED